MSAIDIFAPLDLQLGELHRLVADVRALCYMGRPEEAPPMTTRPAPAAAPDASPCAVHVKRADGLEVEVSGSAAFVTDTLERVLSVLGVIQAPPPA
jgi:hypothetical protein